MFELKSRKLAPLFLFFSALLWSTSGIFTKSVEWSGMSLAVLKGDRILRISADFQGA